MNPKERAVVIFLCAVILTGAVVSTVRHHRLRTRLSSIEVLRARDTVPVTPTDGDPADPAPRTGLIDLNRGSAAELELLPGIGPVLAQRIIDFRTEHGGFRSCRDLRRVSGIGPKKYAAIERLVTVGPVP